MLLSPQILALPNKRPAAAAAAHATALLLEGDMADDATDYLLLEGDMQSGTDVLLLEGDMA